MCSYSAYRLAVMGPPTLGTRDMQAFTSATCVTNLRHGSLMQVVQG